jgi:hypothetical protein
MDAPAPLLVGIDAVLRGALWPRTPSRRWSRSPWLAGKQMAQAARRASQSARRAARLLFSDG